MASLQQQDNASQRLTEANETNKRNKTMHFKLIIAFVEDSKTDDVMNAAREAGATGCTVISNARGEGIKESKTFFGLTLATQRDVVLTLVEQHLSRHILEHIGEVGEFDAKPGTGIAVMVDVEDAVGVIHQAEELGEIVEEKL
jgi:nitrogen regulatory protein PII